MIRAPYWTVRDGVVGTAHLNRHGVEVDFRAGSVRGARTDTIAIQPASGIVVDELIIVAHEVSRELMESYPDLATERWRITIEGEFQGAIIRTRVDDVVRVANYDAVHAAMAKQQQRRIADDQAMRDRLDAAACIAVSPTHREIGRLQSPIPGRRFAALEQIRTRAWHTIGGTGRPPHMSTVQETHLIEAILQLHRDVMSR